jgi:transcription initiation factor TFIIE subunit alpha
LIYFFVIPEKEVYMLTDPIVQEILIDVTHDEESSVSVIECILSGVTSDFNIAEETGINLTIIRKILYDLHSAGIVTYNRIEDPENTSDIYSWKFKQEKIREIIQNKYVNISAEIEKSIEYEEENMFFVCKSNNHRYKFENASDYNFECPLCGDSLEHQDNPEIILELLKEKEAISSMVKLNIKSII